MESRLESTEHAHVREYGHSSHWKRHQEALYGTKSEIPVAKEDRLLQDLLAEVYMLRMATNSTISPFSFLKDMTSSSTISNLDTSFQALKHQTCSLDKLLSSVVKIVPKRDKPEFDVDPALITWLTDCKTCVVALEGAIGEEIESQIKAMTQVRQELTLENLSLDHFDSKIRIQEQMNERNSENEDWDIIVVHAQQMSSQELDRLSLQLAEYMVRLDAFLPVLISDIGDYQIDNDAVTWVDQGPLEFDLDVNLDCKSTITLVRAAVGVLKATLHTFSDDMQCIIDQIQASNTGGTKRASSLLLLSSSPLSSSKPSSPSSPLWMPPPTTTQYLPSLVTSLERLLRVRRTAKAIESTIETYLSNSDADWLKCSAAGEGMGLSLYQALDAEQLRCTAFSLRSSMESAWKAMFAVQDQDEEDDVEFEFDFDVDADVDVHGNGNGDLASAEVVIEERQVLEWEAAVSGLMDLFKVNQKDRASPRVEMVEMEEEQFKGAVLVNLVE